MKSVDVSHSQFNSGVDYSIDIVELSKKFKRQTYRGGYTTIKTMLLNLFTSKKEQVHVTHAVKNFTARVPRGASLGIIGRNGSGKSTLLKLITGIYRPDSGRISINGRIAALIELGAGFHPDFTGRENLYLSGAMHGMSREEIDQRFNQIVRFAELEDVIDDPVRTYSSGMYMRLGFSLAVHTDPDILIVDEVLAVGDAAFVAKCKEKIEGLRKEGKTLLLVSHDLSSIERWCDEVIWINNGAEMDRGSPRRVIDKYRQWIEEKEERELFDKSAEVTKLEEDGDSVDAARWGSREVEILNARLLNSKGEKHALFHSGEKLIVEIEYQINEAVTDLVFGIGINRADGLVVHGTNTDIERVDVPTLGNSGLVRYEIESLDVMGGSYTLDVAVHREDGYPFDYHQGIEKFLVRCDREQAGVYVPVTHWSFSNFASNKAAADAS